MHAAPSIMKWSALRASAGLVLQFGGFLNDHFIDDCSAKFYAGLIGHFLFFDPILPIDHTRRNGGRFLVLLPHGFGDMADLSPKPRKKAMLVWGGTHGNTHLTANSAGVVRVLASYRSMNRRMSFIVLLL